MAIQNGNWVASRSQIGRVKMVNDDGTLDIVLFARDGSVIGRESPVMGGPSGFEPCCAPDSWRKIKKPDFPLTHLAYVEELVEFV